MASVEERIGNLVEKHLGISDRAKLDTNLADLGVNSVDVVNFLNAVKQEFEVEFGTEDASGWSTMRDLIKHLEG